MSVSYDQTHFRRLGLGYRLQLQGSPYQYHCDRITEHREEVTAELQVLRPDGVGVLRRRVNLLAAGGRGSIGDICRELGGITPGYDWQRLLQTVCESVLNAHRNGLSIETVGGEGQQLPPPAFLCDGLLLKGKLNTWLGAGSTGKSTLAKAVCTYYAADRHFLGRPTEAGVPLYLDWEDDKQEFQRVAYDVCRNLEIRPIPNMFWVNMHGRRLRDQVEALGQLIDREQIGLAVIDALAAAGGVPGEHVSFEAIALELEQCLGALPPITVLALDHVTSDEHKAGLVPLKGRGSERKYEMFRNQWSLLSDQEAREQGRHVVRFVHTKFNSGRLRPEFAVELIHRPGELGFVERSLGERPTTERGRIEAFVADNPGQTIKSLVFGLYGTTDYRRVEATRVQLRRLADSGLVWEGDHRWWAGQPGHNGHEPGELPF